MNITNIFNNNKKITKIIKFLNDDKHLKTEEVFNSTELNEKFEFYSGGNHILIILKKYIPKENVYIFNNGTIKRYIFGHPKLIKILEESL